MPNDINPRTLFLELQKQLITELEVSRGAINHPGTKGNATEANWVAMLEKALSGFKRIRNRQQRRNE